MNANPSYRTDANMPLLCDALRKDALLRLNQTILTLPMGNLIRKESMDGDITAFLSDDVVVLHSAAGFYFERLGGNDLETTILNTIQSPRLYLCSALEINTEDPAILTKLLHRFQEQYGEKYVRMMDFLPYTFNSRTLLLVKFPSCVVRQMMAPMGGVCKTTVSGPTQSLKTIPTLQNCMKFPENQSEMTSVFATEYSQGQLHSARKLHYDLVQEVATRPDLGITLTNVAVWDA